MFTVCSIVSIVNFEHVIVGCVVNDFKLHHRCLTVLNGKVFKNRPNKNF